METFSGYTQGVCSNYPFDTSGYIIVEKTYPFREEDTLVLTNPTKFIPKDGTSNLKSVNLPTEYTEDFCKFLGYFVANGSYGNNFFGFSTKDLVVAGEYQSLVRKIFGVEAIKRVHGSNTPSYVVSSVVIKDFLVQDVFKGKHTARFKAVPEGVKNSNCECILAFLVGLFDCDSYLERGYSFIFNTASKDVAQFIHKVLLGFGVVGNLRPFSGVKGYEDHIYWDVRISGKYFYKLLDTLLQGGSLTYEFPVIKKKVNTNFDFVPNMNFWLLDELKYLRDDLGVKGNGVYKTSEGKTERFKISSGYVLEARKSMTYEMLQKLLNCWEELTEQQKILVVDIKVIIEDVLKRDYYFDKILK